MPNVEYDFREYAAKQAEREKGFPKVKYFSLKDNGDDVLVRLNYDDINDIKVVPVHKFKVGDRFMNVACLRSPYETKESCGCPLCREDVEGKKYPVRMKAFIQVVAYRYNAENGELEASPEVWERPALCVNDFITAINNGVSNLLFPVGTSLRDIVFCIQRQGAAGSRDTKYVITARNPAACPENVYKKDFSGFNGFDSSKFGYFVKTAEDMEYFLANGAFKKAEGKNDSKAAKPAAPAAPVTAPAAESPAEDMSSTVTVAEMALDAPLPFEPAPHVVSTPAAAETPAAGRRQKLSL